MNTAPISEYFVHSLGGNAHFLQFLDESTHHFVVQRQRDATLPKIDVHPFVEEVLQYTSGTLPTRSFDVKHSMPPPEGNVTYKEGATIVCNHGCPCHIHAVRKSKSPNLGRKYVRCQQTPSCCFFRWIDDLQSGVNGVVELQNTPIDAVQCPTLPDQLRYWRDLPQGSNEWLCIRKGRITASNFGAVNGTNPFTTQQNHLRSMLWSASTSGIAMKWGSKHEDLAYKILSEYLSSSGVWFETAGIWIPSTAPYLGASPDGIIYVVQSVTPIDDKMEILICVRFLIEIKVPWKLRDRKHHGRFYDTITLPDSENIKADLPAYYYDQIIGNCNLIGLQGCFFFVLSPTGWQLTYMPNNALYWANRLQPVLCEYYTKVVLPAIEQQHARELPLGTIPLDIRASMLFTP